MKLEENLGNTTVLPEGTEFCVYVEKCDKACFKNAVKYQTCQIRKLFVGSKK